MSRRALTGGTRAIAAFVLGFPLSLALSAALSRIPAVPRDAAIAFGFYLGTPLWALVTCVIFVAARPARATLGLTLFAAALFALSRLV